MSFGKRRPRLSRAQLRPSNPIALQQGRLARQRDRLARLAVVGLAILATAAIVHGSGPFFTYRFGERPDREIRVNVDQFERRNLIRTNTLRQAMADQVPLAMVNDPAPIRDLAERLTDLVDAVAKAPTFDAVPETYRSQWMLTPALYDDIREASDTPERHEELARRIDQAFASLIRDGVLGPDILPRHEEGSRVLSVVRYKRLRFPALFAQ